MIVGAREFRLRRALLTISKSRYILAERVCTLIWQFCMPSVTLSV